MSKRYRWDGPVGQPPQVQLIDQTNSRPVATISTDETGWWHWKRNTTRVIHGAPPSEGSTGRGLEQAMREVLAGLPDAE